MKNLLLRIIFLYRKYFPPANVCRFDPTCSQYCYEAIQKYDTIKGLLICFKRVFRCHPFEKGGKDPLI